MDALQSTFTQVKISKLINNNNNQMASFSNYYESQLNNNNYCNVSTNRFRTWHIGANEIIKYLGLFVVQIMIESLISSLQVLYV